LYFILGLRDEKKEVTSLKINGAVSNDDISDVDCRLQVK